MMRVHVLGICGTFMGGIALLARELGHTVSGADLGAYPPMSTLLASSGIPLHEGYDPAQLDPPPDLLVIGNAFSRGNPLVEHALAAGIPYTSGPEFLADHVLPGRWVLALAGTHGKTTTTSLLAWILEDAGLAPGFLIGGAARDFPVPARLGATPFFVVEADEYDTAFFDKRSKFVHYRPRTLIMNNLEFDHADIFPDLDAIKRQFHHLVRTVPGPGLIVAPADDAALADVLAQGCWTPLERFARAGRGVGADRAAGDSAPDGSGWRAEALDEGAGFRLLQGDAVAGEVRWDLPGLHNIDNAVAAVLAARHAGVPVRVALDALGRFGGVRRRLEPLGPVRGVNVYDDFAHHPTAIATTLEGMRRVAGDGRIIAVLEMRSNTMKMGVHRERLAPALDAADAVCLLEPPDLGWPLAPVIEALGARARSFTAVADIVAWLAGHAREGDHVVIMSNGGFEGIHARLIEALGDG